MTHHWNDDPQHLDDANQWMRCADDLPDRMACTACPFDEGCAGLRCLTADVLTGDDT